MSSSEQGGWFSQDSKVGGSIRTTRWVVQSGKQDGGSVRTTRWVAQSGQQGGWFSQDNK